MGFLPRRLLRRIFFFDYVDYVDGLTASALVEIPILDQIRISDSLLYQRHPTVQLADSISVSDRLFTSRQTVVWFRDRAAATDVLTYIRHPTVQFSDRVVVGDLYVPSRRTVLLFGDSINFSDQLPSSKRSSLELRDHISVSDWFFRLRKGLELRDLAAVTDGVYIVPVNVKLFGDYISVGDALEINRHPAVVFTDSIALVDGIELRKSVSPLFASLLYQRPRRRHLKLTIHDYIPLADLVSPVRSTVVMFADTLAISDLFDKVASRVLTFGDYVHIPDYHISINPELRIRDSVDAVDHLSFRLIPVAIFTDSVAVSDRLEFYKSISPLFASLLQQRPRRRYLSLIMSDIIPFADAVSQVKSVVVTFMDTLSISDVFDKVTSRVLTFEDYIYAFDEQAPKQAKIEIADLSDIEDYLSYRLAPVYVFGDIVHIADEIWYTKSISTLFASLLYQRPRRRYLTLAIYDGIVFDDRVSARAGYVLLFRDAVTVSDSVGYGKSVSPLFMTLMSQRPKRRYRTLYLTDVISISDVFTPARGYTVRFEDVILADVFETRTTPTVLFSDFINVEDWIPNYPYVMYYGIYAVMAHRYLTFRDHITVSDSLSAGPPNAVTFRDYILISDSLSATLRNSVTFRDEIRFADAIDVHVNVKGVVFRDRIAISDLTASNRS